MSRSINLYLNDILESINKIKKYTLHMSQTKFLEDERTFDAVVFNLHIIGEASKNIPEEIRNKYPQVQWRKMIGLRNIIAHAYFALDYEILWDIIQTKLDLLNSCIKLIQETENLEEDNLSTWVS